MKCTAHIYSYFLVFCTCHQLLHAYLGPLVFCFFSLFSLPPNKILDSSSPWEPWSFLLPTASAKLIFSGPALTVTLAWDLELEPLSLALHYLTSPYCQHAQCDHVIPPFLPARCGSPHILLVPHLFITYVVCSGLWTSVIPVVYIIALHSAIYPKHFVFFLTYSAPMFNLNKWFSQCYGHFSSLNMNIYISHWRTVCAWLWKYVSDPVR